MHWIKRSLAAIALVCTLPATGAAPELKDLVVIDSERGEPFSSVRQAMLEALAEDGYKDGQTLNIHYASLSNFPGIAQNLWNISGHRKHSYFFINGTIAAAAYKNLAFDDGQHAFIFCAVTDPVGMGLIDGFKIPPKANFSGVSYPVPVKERFRFVKRLFPNARKIGLVYADMPQSHSYRGWVEDLLKNDAEFKGLEVVFRMVPFVPNEGGHKRMAMLAERYVRELDSQVDLFLAPNDQMGVQQPFSEMVHRVASKPLIGIGQREVREGWGATAAISPSLHALGKECATMVRQMLDGKPIRQILPAAPKTFEIAIDAAKARAFGARLSDDLLRDANTRLIGQ